MVKGRQGERVRLYVRGTILGYRRSKSNQYETTSLVQIEAVNTKKEVSWYCGKRMAYIYKAKTKTKGSHYRCIWGKVASCEPSSDPTCLLNPWVARLEFSCTLATYE